MAGGEVPDVEVASLSADLTRDALSVRLVLTLRLLGRWKAQLQLLSSSATG